MNIYVGNLPFEVTEDALQVAFTGYGNVSSARVITDRMTGRSRGFGFVEMPDKRRGGDRHPGPQRQGLPGPSTDRKRSSTPGG